MISGSLRSTFPVESVGSTATYAGGPWMFETVRSNFPSVAVARYGAIGSDSRQTHVVLPAVVSCETSTPFAITVRPWGTVIAKSNVALSRGVSFTPYHPGDHG